MSTKVTPQSPKKKRKGIVSFFKNTIVQGFAPKKNETLNFLLFHTFYRQYLRDPYGII